MKPEVPRVKLSDCKVRKIYEGVLDHHWETGYEGTMLLHLYVDGFSEKNPHYDPKDNKKGPEFYRSYEGMLTFDLGDIIEITDCPSDPTFNGKKFTMGNMEMAKKDKCRFGRAYPMEKMELSQWSFLFQGNTKAKVHKLITSVRLYGGTFDPIHKGHEYNIREAHYAVDQVLVLVGNNWTKENQPVFSLDERINACEVVAKKFLNVEVVDWSKTMDTTSTWDVAEKIKEIYGFYPQIVIGADNVDQLPRWRNWDKLKNLMFAIVPREGYITNPDVLNQINYIQMNKSIEVSSTEIRSGKKLDQISDEVKSCLDLRKLKL